MKNSRFKIRVLEKNPPTPSQQTKLNIKAKPFSFYNCDICTIFAILGQITWNNPHFLLNLIYYVPCIFQYFFWFDFFINVLNFLEISRIRKVHCFIIVLTRNIKLVWASFFLFKAYSIKAITIPQPPAQPTPSPLTIPAGRLALSD